MKSNIQKELVESAKQIREKYRALKRGQFLQDEERFQTFKPLIEPLEELKNIAKYEKEQNLNKELSLQSLQSQPSLPKTPSRIPIPYPTPQNFGNLAAEYLGNYLNKQNKTDTTYGIRREDSKFYIGDKEVEIDANDVIIGNKTYKGTKGLWELLTLKRPTNHTQSDLETYKEILVLTNAHLKNYKPGAPLSSNKHTKYTDIIKPMFKTVGEGLRQVTGNKIDYVYWNDPNELVNRLRLLWLSRNAGNTGVNNEIDSIIEELRESNIIY